MEDGKRFFETQEGIFENKMNFPSITKAITSSLSAPQNIAGIGIGGLIIAGIIIFFLIRK